MIVAIHQPEHLSYAGFFDKIRRADILVLLDNVDFEKNNFQNRNRINGHEGPQWITVPVLNGTKHIKDTLIDQNQWKRFVRKNLRGIEWAYGRSLYFKEYFPEFQAVYSAEYSTIAEMNTRLLVWLINVLLIGDIFKEFVVLTASKICNQGTKSELLANICKELRADTYLSGICGKDYLDQELFYERGIKVRFHDFKHPVYTQYGKTEFTPNLSIIDMLFNCGKGTMKIIEAANK